MIPWPAVLTDRIPLDFSWQRAHLPAQPAPAVPAVQSRQRVIAQTELNLQTFSPCSPAAMCIVPSISCMEPSSASCPTVCRASCARCELLPCSSQGCHVAGWEASEPSASPHFAWPVWRPIAALCDRQGCSASTKTALKAQSVEPTELSCSFQTLLRAQHVASQCHWITALRTVFHSISY